MAYLSERSIEQITERSARRSIEPKEDDQDDIQGFLADLSTVLRGELKLEMTQLTAQLRIDVNTFLHDSSLKPTTRSLSIPIARDLPGAVEDDADDGHAQFLLPTRSAMDVTACILPVVLETDVSPTAGRHSPDLGPPPRVAYTEDASMMGSTPSMGRDSMASSQVSGQGDPPTYPEESKEFDKRLSHHESRQSHDSLQKMLVSLENGEPRESQYNIRRAVTVNNDPTELSATSIAYSMIDGSINNKQRMMLLFDILPAMVILANSVTLAMSQDVLTGHMVWDVLECIWVSCYTIECFLKILAFGLRTYFFGSDRYWNRFDFVCLLASLVDVALTLTIASLIPGGGIGLLKTLRLFRVARLVRALHFSFFVELKSMVLGLLGGGRVLFWALVLLMLTFFVIGLGTRILFGDTDENFRTLSHSMLTVFRCFTDGCVERDGSALNVLLFEKHGPVFFFAYILTFLVVTVGIFNLIIAIYIENVVSSSHRRRMVEIGDSSVKIEVQLLAIMARFMLTDNPGLKCAGDGMVTRAAFDRWLEEPELEALLELSDIEVTRKSELFEVLDVGMAGEMSLTELIGGLMRLRGPIVKSDIVAVRLKVRYMTSMVEDIWWKADQKAVALRESQEDDDSPPVMRRADSNVGLSELRKRATGGSMHTRLARGKSQSFDSDFRRKSARSSEASIADSPSARPHRLRRSATEGRGSLVDEDSERDSFSLRVSKDASRFATN